MSRSTKDVCELEADKPHADMIVQELHFGGGCFINIPGETEAQGGEGNGMSLQDEQASKYRALAARANNAAADRTDFMYSVTKICLSMADLIGGSC